MYRKSSPILLTRIKKPYGIDTFRLIQIFLRNKIPYNKFHFFGLKDRYSISNQFLIVNIKIYDKVLNVLTKNYIHCDIVGFISQDITGDLILGNIFKIFIWGNVSTRLVKNFFELYSFNKLPNFYGYQRFGIERINHLVGKAILKKDVFSIKDLIYRGYIANLKKLEENNSGDIELEEMLNKFPKSLVKLYVNSYQSYLFNRVLSYRILDGYPLNICLQNDYCSPNASPRNIFICHNRTCKGNPLIPLIGYSYIPKNRFSDKYYIELLKEEDIKPRDFYLGFKGLKFFGGFRFASLNLRNLYVVMKKDKKSVFINFFMNRGMYATIFLRELIKPQFPSKHGF